MIKQLLFQVQPNKRHILAVSRGEGSRYTENNPSIAAITPCNLSAPVFYQHPVGNGIAVSCSVPHPSGEKDSSLVHQLIFDNENALRTLRHMRPLCAQTFFSVSADGTLNAAALNAASEDHAVELRRCFQTLKFYFDKKENVLAAFIGAVAFCARNRRFRVRVMLSDSPEQITQVGHDLMELLLRVMRSDDAVRVSYASLMTNANDDRACTVFFMPRPTRRPPFSPNDILLDLSTGNLTLPQGVFLPAAEQNARLALALLAQDIGRADGICGKNDTEPAYTHSAALVLPPFGKETDLSQYFRDWQHTVLLRRSSMSADGFRRFVLNEWTKLTDALITASECMDTDAFLFELSTLILNSRPPFLPEELCPGEQTLTDLKVLLLDSVDWDALDLSDPLCVRLMRQVCAFSTDLTGEEYDTADYVLSCRMLHRMLHTPIGINDALTDLSLLREYCPPRFRQVQSCLKRCVKKRLEDEFDSIDEKFAAAALLSIVRFNEGIPDLRRISVLSEQVESVRGRSAARRFDQISDRLRSLLRMSDSFTFRISDINRIFLACGVVASVLLGIAAWYWLR